MNHRWLAAVGGCLTSAGLAVAAPPAPPANLPLSLPAAETVPAAKDVGPPVTATVVLPANPMAAPDGCSACAPPACGNGCGCGPQWWGSADYLLWWVKGAPLPIPLVTTGDPTAPFSGVIGQPGTRVLLGNQDIDASARSGFRLNAGGYLDSEGLIGVDAGFFLLERASKTYDFVGGPNGAPVLGHPFVVTTTNREDLYFFSFPADIIGIGVIGQSAVTSETRFGGYDVNVALNLWQERGLSIRGLVGFRNLILNESLTITDTLAASDPGTVLVVFRGGLVDPPSGLVISDSFVVHNRFYGGQVGSQVDWSNGRWSVGVLGKLALGVTQQLALINGETRVIGPAGPQSAVGGTFAQVTNIGRHYRSELAVVPEVGLNVGYAATDWLTVRLGYTFLYWSNVARPGDLLNRRINPHQVPSDFTFGTPGGPASPSFAFRSADFWAQGLNLGLEVRF